VTVLDAVESVLATAGTPLSYREIVDRILKTGLWQTRGKTPRATVNAQLAVDVKKHGPCSRFQRMGSGMYGLRAWGLSECQSSIPSGEPSPVVTDEPSAPSLKAMSFTDAAEWVLTTFANKMPMHYRTITELALKGGAISTTGRTPEATLYAQVLTEIARQQQRGETPRFVKHGKGLIGLSRWMPSGLALQIEQHNSAVRKELRERLAAMPPKEFEGLISQLLVAIGFEDVEVTSYSGDGGIDVRGTLVVAGVIRLRMAVQAKRWKANVQAPMVQQVRGSLGTHDQGLIITTSDFSARARVEAERPNADPVALMNGEQLVALMVEHGIGVRRTSHAVLTLADAAEVE
jgi:restriction system protein